MNQNLRTILLLISLVPAHLFAGGPWTQPAKKGYSQVSFTGIFAYDKLFEDGDAGAQLHRDITDITMLGYFEYGLTDRLTLIGYIPYKAVKSADEINPSGAFPDTLEAGSLRGFGNLALAAKLNFNRRGMVVSTQLRIDAKTVNEGFNTGLRTGYSAWAFTPSLIVGKGWDKWYAFSELGVRLRTNDYSNDFTINMEAGYLLFGRLWIAGVVDILQTISGDTLLADGSEQTGLYANGQEFFAYGIKLLYEISPKWGVNASSFSASSGHLVPKTAPFTFGLYHKW